MRIIRVTVRTVPPRARNVVLLALVCIAALVGEYYLLTWFYAL
jgi:hypothetical protein